MFCYIERIWWIFSFAHILRASKQIFPYEDYFLIHTLIPCTDLAILPELGCPQASFFIKLGKIIDFHIRKTVNHCLCKEHIFFRKPLRTSYEDSEKKGTKKKKSRKKEILWL